MVVVVVQDVAGAVAARNPEIQSVSTQCTKCNLSMYKSTVDNVQHHSEQCTTRDQGQEGGVHCSIEELYVYTKISWV